MNNTQSLLVEIGTEEMPPKSLKRLAIAFKQDVNKLLQERDLGFRDSNWFATPRRLAVIINDLEVTQRDRAHQRRGPAISTAFDENGKPTRATEGFAKSCGVAVDQLERLETGQGSWLSFNTVIRGKSGSELIPDIIQTALKRLPVAKRMRWGDNDFEFVRPVKWVLVLFGEQAIDCNIMGITSGKNSYGHRFHHPVAVTIKRAEDYVDALEQARVLVNFENRQQLILDRVNALAREQGGKAVIDHDLLDEVTALLEWPVAFTGEFDPAFLKLPKEVLIASMQDHQKYFPVINEQGELLPCFISTANIESKEPDLIRQGNERVIQPRLSDAAFFWGRDLKHGLANHIPGLKKVIYQKQLGTLHEKSRRLITLVNFLAAATNTDREKASRAAELCLCDLLTEMVSEFPGLQGTMGRYYAEADGEDNRVAVALEEFYQPRFADDGLPDSDIGQCLAISEKIDSIVGIFALGKPPTGDKDPFGLRRSAIGLLRIIIECGLDIDLMKLIETSAANYPAEINAKTCIEHIYHFMMERLRRYYLDKGIGQDTFESVLAIKTTRPVDFDQRLKAVTEFRKLSEAESLAAANKRISNILMKSGIDAGKEINQSLLTEESEINLLSSLSDYQKRIMPLLAKRDYKGALTELAGLREDVDNFFDNVMVMCDETDVKKNRLALLNSLSALFLETADISKLQN